jgi:hypothetical protein
VPPRWLISGLLGRPTSFRIGGRPPARCQDLEPVALEDPLPHRKRLVPREPLGALKCDGVDDLRAVPTLLDLASLSAAHGERRVQGLEQKALEFRGMLDPVEEVGRLEVGLGLHQGDDLRRHALLI